MHIILGEKKIVNKGPFIEQLRGKVSSVSNTVLSTELKTPVSKTTKIAMLIHWIRFKMTEPTFSAGAITTLNNCLSKRSHVGDADIPQPDDPDVLYRVDRWAQEGILAATFGRGQTNPMLVEFDPPLLYARDEIFFEAVRSAAVAGGGDMFVNIGYTLEEVSQQAYIDALVEG